MATRLAALQEIEASLISDLIGIQKMITDIGGIPRSVNEPAGEKLVRTTSTKKEKPQPEGTPIGKQKWDAYIDLVGDTLGDTRTAGIVEYMRKANPSIPLARITDAVKKGLTKKVKADTLPYTKGSNRKAGYTYHFRQRTNKMQKVA